MSGRENDDVEAGVKLPGEEEEEDNVDQSDPFDVSDTKNASLETLRRWRLYFLSILRMEPREDTSCVGSTSSEASAYIGLGYKYPHLSPLQKSLMNTFATKYTHQDPAWPVAQRKAMSWRLNHQNGALYVFEYGDWEKAK